MTHQQINDTISTLLGVPETITEYTNSLDACADAKRRLIVSYQERFAFLKCIRKVIGRRCEVNKCGAPIVTDWDMIDATPMEICEAILIVKGKNK